jgi:hypothetical protein
MPSPYDDAANILEGALEGVEVAPSASAADLQKSAGTLGNLGLNAEWLAAWSPQQWSAQTDQRSPRRRPRWCGRPSRKRPLEACPWLWKRGLEEALAELVVLSAPNGESSLELAILDPVRHAIQAVLSASNREAGRLVGGACRERAPLAGGHSQPGYRHEPRKHWGGATAVWKLPKPRRLVEGGGT